MPTSQQTCEKLQKTTLHNNCMEQRSIHQIRNKSRYQTKTEYLKSGTIERYKTTKFSQKNINHNAYENKNIGIGTVCIKVEKKRLTLF